MVTDVVRTHIVVPRDLVDAVDGMAGRRKRSEFVIEALREKLARELRTRALQEGAGILAAADYPEWETPEKTSAWVRGLRAVDSAATTRKLGGRDGR